MSESVSEDKVEEQQQQQTTQAIQAPPQPLKRGKQRDNHLTNKRTKAAAFAKAQQALNEATARLEAGCFGWSVFLFCFGWPACGLVGLLLLFWLACLVWFGWLVTLFVCLFVSAALFHFLLSLLVFVCFFLFEILF